MRTPASLSMPEARPARKRVLIRSTISFASVVGGGLGIGSVGMDGGRSGVGGGGMNIGEGGRVDGEDEGNGLGGGGGVEGDDTDDETSTVAVGGRHGGSSAGGSNDDGGNKVIEPPACLVSRISHSTTNTPMPNITRPKHPSAPMQVIAEDRLLTVELVGSGTSSRHISLLSGGTSAEYLHLPCVACFLPLAWRFPLDLCEALDLPAWNCTPVPELELALALWMRLPGRAGCVAGENIEMYTLIQLTFMVTRAL